MAVRVNRLAASIGQAYSNRMLCSDYAEMREELGETSLLGPVRQHPILCRLHSAMKTSPSSPKIPDNEVAIRIALVREMTEAARVGAIRWAVRDRRLRTLFCVREASRAFDSTRPCYGH